MRVRTRSACVVLAWGILLLLVAAGSSGSPRPAQANNRTASTTSISTISTIHTTLTSTRTSTLTSSVTSSLAGRPDAAAALPALRRAGTDTAAEAIADAPTDTGKPTGTAASTDVGQSKEAGAPTDADARAGIGTYVARPDAAYVAQPGDARSGIAAARATRPGSVGYVVQPGDTLSGIALALGVRGGWPALYAANRQLIGPDPDVIRAGLALALPGPSAPVRYTVATGDTLAGIAAALRTHGGWPALYAANRQIIGSDPDVIRAGAVLTIPRPATASRPVRRPSPPPTTTPAPTRTPATAPTPAPTTARRPVPAPASASVTGPARAPTAGGLPRWLQFVLLAAGILIGAAFLAEPALAISRRRRNARQNARPATGPTAYPTAERRIVLADYDRLVVTSSGPDGTVCVLRPPGADPEVILLAARLVLAQDRYDELAGHLGVAAHSRGGLE